MKKQKIIDHRVATRSRKGKLYFRNFYVNRRSSTDPRVYIAKHVVTGLPEALNGMAEDMIELILKSTIRE